MTDRTDSPPLTCRCGHADINHSDISLDALGACYHCDCKEFTRAKASGEGLRAALVAEMEAEGVVTWGDDGHRARFLTLALATPTPAEHEHIHIGTGPRVEPTPWSCMGCGRATNAFVTGSLVHPEDGLCQRCVDAIRATPAPAGLPQNYQCGWCGNVFRTHNCPDALVANPALTADPAPARLDHLIRSLRDEDVKWRDDPGYNFALRRVSAALRTAPAGLETVNTPGTHYIDGDGEEWVVGEHGTDHPANEPMGGWEPRS